MGLRQEQWVFIAALGVVFAGLLGKGSEPRASRDRGGSEVLLPRFQQPIWPESGLPALAGAPQKLLDRAVFSPPRDTRPLDPLEFVSPPLAALRQLAPPGDWGPAPAAYARLLGREQRVLEQADLFLEPQDATPVEPVQLVSPFAGARSFSDLDPTERLEAQAAFRGQYDWLRTEAELLFGQIVDSDRFGLLMPARAQDPVGFLQINPFTGDQRFPGQPPIPYERSRAVEFGFADTPANRLEIELRELPDPLTPGSYPAALALAEAALQLRFEAPRGPAIAEQLYRRAVAFKPEDPAPRIGLASTLEAAHDYAGALAEFERLCGQFPSRAEPWVALGELQERFLDQSGAESSLRRAVSVERGSHQAHAALGRFLFSNRRFQEARAEFDSALDHSPAALDGRGERLELRLWQARAELAMGAIDAAMAHFSAALATEPGSGAAAAGLAECARLQAGQARAARSGAGTPAPGFEADGTNLTGGGRELALARGLTLIDSAQAASGAGRSPLLFAARSELENALGADPLRAARPLAALSYLAECTAQPGESLDYATRALLADPTDPWVLYQRGRLLRSRQDFDAAAAHLQAALGYESEFEDALAELGELALDQERFEDAARYFERAEELADRRQSRRADLVARRALAAVFQQAYREARGLYRQALEIDSRLAEARAGLAWCEYRLGNLEEGLIQLRNLDDSLRDRGPGDPLRAWALAQIARIEDHRSKDIWTDRFEYTRLGNGWQVDEAAGPTVSLANGELLVQGNFKSTGEVRFWREYAATEFVAIDAELSILPTSSVRAGLFVAREVRRSNGIQLQAMAALARARDGTTQILALDTARGEEGWVDLSRADFPFPEGRPVHVRIERVPREQDEVINILMDGVPVLEGRSMLSLGRGNAPLKIGVFAQGETGRQVFLTLDDVEITRRIR